jgi:hypothetical protein
MAKKAQTAAPKRAKSPSQKPNTAPLAVQCVYRVGDQEFADADAAATFCEQHSRRSVIVKLATEALALAPARGRNDLKAGIEHLTNVLVENPGAWAAALQTTPGAVSSAPVAAAPPAVARKRAAVAKAAPVKSAAASTEKKTRVRRTYAQIAADNAAAEGKTPATPAPAAVAPTPAPIAVTSNLPPPPP